MSRRDGIPWDTELKNKEKVLWPHPLVEAAGRK